MYVKPVGDIENAKWFQAPIIYSSKVCDRARSVRVNAPALSIITVRSMFPGGIGLPSVKFVPAHACCELTSGRQPR